MTRDPDAGGQNRREFLKNSALGAVACLLSGGGATAAPEIEPRWKDQIGLELYTVRGLLEKDYAGTIAKVAAIGYKEVEPARSLQPCSRRSTRRCSISTTSRSSVRITMPPTDPVSRRSSRAWRAWA